MPGNANLQGVYAHRRLRHERWPQQRLLLRHPPRAVLDGHDEEPADASSTSQRHRRCPPPRPMASAQTRRAATPRSTTPARCGPTMLWECYAALLRERRDSRFDEAQDRMKQLPRGRVQAHAERADVPRGARRACSPRPSPATRPTTPRFSAPSPSAAPASAAKAPDRDSADHIGVVESFVNGNNMEVTSITPDDSVAGCDQDGVLDVGETGLLTVRCATTAWAPWVPSPAR